MSWLFCIILFTVVEVEAKPSLPATASEEIGLEDPPLFDPPATEDVESRTYSLGKVLRCPVCQGLSVADSRSDAAVAMKNRIQELVELGYSDDQIIDYFVERYGEFTLLRPKDKHWFVWFAPSMAIVLGLSVVALQWRRKQGTEEGKPDFEQIDLTESSENLDSYREQILKELGED